MRCYKTIFIALIAVFMFVSCEFDSKNKSTNEVTRTSPVQIPKDADFEYRAAVMDFRPNGNLTHKDVEGISMIFATYFHPDGYSMIERSQIETVLKEQGIQKQDITEQQMVEIGKIMNLAYIVIGDVTLQMNEYNVDVRLVNVETGKVIASEGATFSKYEGSYREYLESIAYRLSSKVPTKPVVKKAIKKETEGKKFDDVIVLYDYLKVFPTDLGYFDGVPSTIISKINEGEQYGYCTWRIPTKEELSLLQSNGIVPSDVDYISSTGGSYKGRVRLVTDNATCAEVKARIAEELAEAERQRIEQARKEALKAQGYVDLGLPSGTLWKDKNEDGGFYKYDQAISRFRNNLPTEVQFEELIYSCQWIWNDSGYNVVGPSGNSIVLPAAGHVREDGGVIQDQEDPEGIYWSSTPYGSDHAFGLYISSYFTDIICNFSRSNGLCVRLVQD